MFFGLKLVITALALGILFQDLFTHGSQKHRLTFFCFGSALAPFVIGLANIIFSLISSPAMALLLARYFLLCIGSSYLLWAGVSGWRKLPMKKRSISDFTAHQYLAAFAIVVLVVLFARNFVLQTQIPLVNHDALVYANEAKHFAQDFRYAAIPNFSDTGSNLAASHPHGFLFQAYLADAVLADDDPDDLNDYPLRIAFQATVLLLLASIVALASVWGNFFSIVGTLFFVLLHHWLQYISVASSRDGFRLIPLFLIITLLSLALRYRHHLPGGLRYAILIAFLTFFAIQAHTLNVVILPLIVGAWLSVAYLGKVERTTVWMLIAGIAAGGFGGMLHYANSIYDTGSPLGYGFYYYAYYGTALWEHQQSLDYFHTEHLDLLGILTRYFNFDQEYSSSLFSSKLLCVAGMLAAPLYIYHNGKVRKDLSRLFLGLLIPLLILPNLGAFDFTSLDLSKMFIVNKRYFLYWFILVAILLGDTLFGAGLAASVFDACRKTWRGPGLEAVMQPLRVAAFLLFGFAAFAILRDWYVLSKPYWSERNGFYKVSEYLAHIEGQHTVLIDHLGVDYYSEAETSFIYAKKNWPLFHAKEKGAVKAFLHAANIDYVVLSEDLKNWWRHAPLGECLVDNDCAVELFAFESWHVYGITH